MYLLQRYVEIEDGEMSESGGNWRSIRPESGVSSGRAVRCGLGGRSHGEIDEAVCGACGACS